MTTFTKLKDTIMDWKNFFYYRKGERIAIIFLLILIVLTLLLNIGISLFKKNEIVVYKNEAFEKEFADFEKSLKSSTEYELTEEKEGYTTISKSQSKKISEPIVGKPQSQKKSYSTYKKQEKLADGETISLNETDTAQWKKVPGIGSAYALRIVKYQEMLGGFASKNQLLEVYGIDNEMYLKISPFIAMDSNVKKVNINKLEFKDLLKHPYLNYEQVKEIVNLRKRKGRIASINELSMLDSFSEKDIRRLSFYLEF